MRRGWRDNWRVNCSMVAGAATKRGLECGHTPQTAMLVSLSENEEINRCVKVM